MKDNIITIEIARPVEDVFEFTINPNNTHLWIDSVIKERIDTTEIGLGTKYYQVVRLIDGNQGFEQAIISAFIKNKLIEFSYIGTTYKCRYSYKSTIIGTTLTYIEEAENDEDLSMPMERSTLYKLKKILEETL